MNKALFLDRDGILNKAIMRNGIASSPRSIAEFEVIQESEGLIRDAKNKGYVVIVVTNQPDVSRGSLSMQDLEAMHGMLGRRLPIDDLEVCTSSDDSDQRRKPNPGMILDAARKHSIDLSGSLLLGDGEKDILAGKKAGVKTILLQAYYNKHIHGSADFNCNTMQEIVRVLSHGNSILTFTEEFLSKVRNVIDGLKVANVEEMAQVLHQVRQAGGRVFFIGSGGGAGHASHATCDFRKIGGFEAYCPTDNVSELTARINDDGWASSLSNYLKGSAIKSRDCVFVFSVGGGSEEKQISTNLVNAVKCAKDVGARVVGIVGRDGGYTARHADACVVIPTVDNALVTPMVEGFQALIWHMIISHPLIQKNAMKWESTK